MMELITNFLRDQGLLEAVSLGTALALIAIVGAHILEERLKGFRRFFNRDWFKTGQDEFPVSKREALFKDQILLFLTLTLLALGGTKSVFFILVAVGFITADLIQHSVFTIVGRKYTPGVATSALYLMYVVYFALVVLGEITLGPEWALTPMVLGGILLVGNYIMASIKVRGSPHGRRGGDTPIV